MLFQNTHTFSNPNNNTLIFQIKDFNNNAAFLAIQKLNYYLIILIKKGKGKLKANCSEYEIVDNTILFFAPHQPFAIETNQNLEGEAIYFHSDFFCIYKHQNEIACNGILFNDVYKAPFFYLNSQEMEKFSL